MATESIFHNIVIDDTKKLKHSLLLLNKLLKQPTITLSTFMCPLNLDVEDFIHNKAIEK